VLPCGREPRAQAQADPRSGRGRPRRRRRRRDRSHAARLVRDRQPGGDRRRGERLGVDPGKLSDALRRALADQIDSLVASGRLSQAQGDALKQRIQSGQAPLFGGRFGFDHGHGFGRFGAVGLGAAAGYLGVSGPDLRNALASGKTLAQVAQEHGKSVEGLVSALVDAAKQKLDAAVSAGRITQAQEDSFLSHLKQRATDLVNGSGGRPFLGPGFRYGRPHVWRGGPPAGPTFWRALPAWTRAARLRACYLTFT